MSIDVTAGVSLSARVAEEIRALMARRQIRQSQLARQIGVGEQWLSVRLRGKQPIDLNDLELIATALGVHPGVFLSTPETKGHQPPRHRARRPASVEIPHATRGKSASRPPSYPHESRRPALTGRHPFE